MRHGESFQTSMAEPLAPSAAVDLVEAGCDATNRDTSHASEYRRQRIDEHGIILPMTNPTKEQLQMIYGENFRITNGTSVQPASTSIVRSRPYPSGRWSVTADASRALATARQRRQPSGSNISLANVNQDPAKRVSPVHGHTADQHGQSGLNAEAGKLRTPSA